MFGVGVGKVHWIPRLFEFLVIIVNILNNIKNFMRLDIIKETISDFRRYLPFCHLLFQNLQLETSPIL